MNTNYRWFLLEVWPYFKFKWQWLHLKHNLCRNEGKCWSLLATVNCLKMHILFDSKWKKILSGRFLISYTDPQFPQLFPCWRVHGMKFSCFLFLSEFCGVLCLCTPPGFYSFCHTLDLGPSHREMFSDAEPESHIRRMTVQLIRCLVSLFLPVMHSPVLLSLWSSDLWDGCIRSSFCILRVLVLFAKKKKMRLYHFVRCISHSVVTNQDFYSVP